MDAYINRVTIKKDGVYLSSRYKEDKNYHSQLNPSLTAVYNKEGKLGLDRAIIRMFYEYCGMTGSHRSIDRYRFAMESEDAKKAWKEYRNKRDEKWKELNLTEEDARRQYDAPTTAWTEYKRTDKELENALYTKLAKLCRIYDTGLVDEYKELQAMRIVKSNFEDSLPLCTNEEAKKKCKGTIARLGNDIAALEIKMENVAA